MSRPEIIAVRSWGRKGDVWEVETLGSDRLSRYSYWTKTKYRDELAAYQAAQAMLNGEINGCDYAPKEQTHEHDDQH